MACNTWRARLDLYLDGELPSAELADLTWKAAIQAAGARVRFFNNLRALTAYLLFPSWDSLIKTLAFQIAPPLPS